MEYILAYGFRLWFGGKSQSLADFLVDVLGPELVKKTIKVVAVEFRTHWMNHQSRAAIARLGAKQDGVLRSHRIMADGSLRDTVGFSIIAPEWPAVRSHLLHKLERAGV